MVKKVSTVFILGAGFSKGYNPERVPLIHEFLDIAEKRGVLKPEGEHKELIDFVERYFGEYANVNIENLASFLTTELIPDLDQRNIYREKLYRQLISIVTDTLSEIQDHPVNEVVQDTYKEFVDKVVKNRTNIITFNYDLILDKLLLDTGNWWHTTGYGVEIPLDVECLVPMDDSEMQYLKLHGSLNWSRRIVPHPKYGDRIVLSPFGFNVNHKNFPHISTGSPSESFYDPFVVPPIMTKDSFYKNTLLQNIWYEAKDLLCKANEIFIIGYSFPLADFTAEFLFRQSIASPSSEKDKKVRIINKRIDEAYKNRVKSIFQKATLEYREEDVVAFLKTYTEEFIDRTTYRANDIRGVADSQLTDEFCYLAGLAFVALLRHHRNKESEKLTVVVGKDVRTSGPRIKAAFTEALLSRGVHVIDIAPGERVSSTPLLYFATWLFDADGGVEVTGSHLDKEWNGFKLCIGSESTSEEHIREMFSTAKQLEADFEADRLHVIHTGICEREEVDVLADYHMMIAANIILRDRWEELALQALSKKRSLRDALATAHDEIERLPEARRKPLAGLKLVYDAGNGTTGVIAPPVFRELGAEVLELYSEPDGTFPHHLPDPTIPRFLDDLRAEVARTNAHIGLASDCDGDRAGAVSPSGKMIIGEQILALLCKHILKEHPGATIVYDTKCSDAIREIIAENGGVPVECKTGFAFVKAKMAELGAAAGGEMSGHVYFAKNNRADDAVFAFSELLLLAAKELRARKDAKVVDGLLADFRKRYVNTPEIRITVANDEEKERVSDAVEEYYRGLAAANPNRYKRRVDEKGKDIDGVKIEFVQEEGWALIRRSNTSPVIIVRMEARTEEGLREIEEQVIQRFKEYKTVDLDADEYVKEIMRRVKRW